MKQRLGPKKHRRVEAIVGVKMRACWTRGGWEHYTCLAVGEDGNDYEVNYKTGEWKIDTWAKDFNAEQARRARANVWWRRMWRYPLMYWRRWVLRYRASRIARRVLVAGAERQGRKDER